MAHLLHVHKRVEQSQGLRFGSDYSFNRDGKLLDRARQQRLPLLLTHRDEA